jgi:hypothetical protein
MKNKNFFTAFGLVSIGALAMSGCGGGGGSVSPKLTVSVRGGITIHAGTVQESATSGSEPMVIKVKVDGVVVDSYIGKNTSVEKGEKVNVVLQDKPIMPGLSPVSPGSVELQLPDETTGEAKATGLFLQSDGYFDVLSAAPARDRVPKTLTEKRRRDTTNWFQNRIVFAGAQQLTDGVNTLSIRNGIAINTWDQYFTPAGSLTQYVTVGQPTWSGTIPADGGDAAGTQVTFHLPKRTYDHSAIYEGFWAQLTIKVNQKYAYDQTLTVDSDNSVTFKNQTHQDHDNIPSNGVSQLTLDIIKQ